MEGGALEACDTWGFASGFSYGPYSRPYMESMSFELPRDACKAKVPKMTGHYTPK